MSAYALGVDLGTTYTAAAIARGSGAQPMQLGTEAAQMPSVVLIRDGGEVLVGDAAERRAAIEPARAAREFKRRMGDPVPLVLGGAPHRVEELMGHLLRDVVARATQQEGESPTAVVLTHPANWADFKLGVLRDAALFAGIDAVGLTLLSEPEAAAISYTRHQRVDDGEVVAVYDFGGGTFDAAVVRRRGGRFELVGVPEGMERLGGIDFDQAVFAHVDSTLGGLVTSADRDDPQTLPAQFRLRTECRRAKETLSVDADATIHVALPGVQTDVRLTRDEMERMLRPRVAQTVQALERTVASAQLRTDQVSRVLLVGGTSRIPLVGEMVRQATGVPVALDAHPKLAIAVGAALHGAASVPPPVAHPHAPAPSSWQPPVRQAPPAAGASRSPRTRWLAIGAGAAVGVLAVIAAAALTGGSDDKDGSSLTSPASTTAGTAADDQVTRGADAIVDSAALSLPAGASIVALAAGSDGALHVLASSGLVLRVTDGQATEVGALNPAEGVPGGVAVTADGTVLVTARRGVFSLAAGATTLLVDGAANGLGSTPGPVAVDGVGNVYVADNEHHRIVRRATDGGLFLVAGNGAVPDGVRSGDGQAATDAALGAVTALAIDRSGSLWFADATTLAVGTIDSAGVMHHFAGGGTTPLQGGDGVLAADGTPGGDLAFAALDGLAVSPSGTVFVADASSGAVVRLDGRGSSVVIARHASASGDDGVPARESGVAKPGVLLADADTLWFADGDRLRFVTGL